MPFNFSIKNVPDVLADRLRQRAGRNRRSLQKELLSILEAATNEHCPPTTFVLPRPSTLSIEEVAARSRKLFPRGTRSSVGFIRRMRDDR